MYIILYNIIVIIIVVEYDFKKYLLIINECRVCTWFVLGRWWKSNTEGNPQY